MALREPQQAQTQIVVENGAKHSATYYYYQNLPQNLDGDDDALLGHYFHHWMWLLPLGVAVTCCYLSVDATDDAAEYFLM
ncbi:hypothetical protein NCWK1_3974 [Nostoc cycadae WK-1]|uniref:Uncharacterized protein n=1 Tax=Nostoc cycadae WK-1 TaxID=1861711 RepID=A0A2H6LLV8_9NOSO|nr:hypothetical protein NCWK1_3974 [Nostoc cycadae WK-1]